jgi:hypothetical protein
MRRARKSLPFDFGAPGLGASDQAPSADIVDAVESGSRKQSSMGALP